MFRGEQLELRLHERPALFLFQRLMWICGEGFLHPRLWLCPHERVLLACPAPEVIEAMINRNPVEPRREPRSATEVVQRLEDLHENILRDIFRLSAIV